MALDQSLIDAAVAQLDRRFPDGATGVAAAVALADGRVLTSICLDNLNSAVGLCAETGALCQAYTEDVAVVASACVARDDGDPEIFVLAPCGICQERLALWGADVLVAVADPSAPAGWSPKTLREVNPHYWGERYADGPGPWPTAAFHAESAE